jgi:hypothetical protein
MTTGRKFVFEETLDKRDNISCDLALEDSKGNRRKPRQTLKNARYLANIKQNSVNMVIVQGILTLYRRSADCSI